MLDKPAGGAGFIVARDGHLYEGGKRFRIFGVNTAFGANFPMHADAEKIAARMAKFGINCVRFHHMDNEAAPSGIWSADMRTLDPGQLDKLDYFIAQLKKNGIYADLNLHVSREYPGMAKWEGMPSFFKGVDNFYPPMVAMQRDYARALLTHINPYTHTAYVDEPAVALIEINNENGLLGIWWNGALDGMSDEYRDDLQARWNRWLQAKYPTQEALEKTWNAGDEPAGAEMLKDAGFEHGAGGAWVMEQQGGAVAGASCKGGEVSIQVSRTDGIGWHVQLGQPGLSFSKGKHYTVSFSAGANSPRRIEIVASQAHEPWNQLWSTSVELTGDLKQHRFTFQPSEDETNGRIVFSNLGAAEGEYQLKGPSLVPGGSFGLQKSERLGSIPGFKKSEMGMRSEAAERDWIAFLYDTESQYWAGMRDYLRHDLKAHSLIVGTPGGYSPTSIQAGMDVVDSHEYWHHPQFPHKAWDMNDWTIDNVSMAGVPNGGTLPSLAERRVAGKPFICTEYSAPAPNSYSSESILLLAAYAALQDWDGVFLFAYSHRTDDWDTRHVTNFFDVDQHPTKLATFPASVAMFVRGDVSMGKSVTTFPVSPQEAIDASMHKGSWWGMEQFGMERMLPLRSRVQFDFSGAAGSQAAFSGTGKVTTSDTGQLTWDADKSRVLIDTPRSKAFIGRITGEPIKFKGVIIEPKSNTQNWAAITVTYFNAGATPQNMTPSDKMPRIPRDILIAATGYMENTGMQWKSPAHDSVGSNWGTAPSLVEGISAKIHLPSNNGLHVWALDARGQRKTAVPITRTESDGAVIEIGPQYQTLWYEAEYPDDKF